MSYPAEKLDPTFSKVEVISLILKTLSYGASLALSHHPHVEADITFSNRGINRLLGYLCVFVGQERKVISRSTVDTDIYGDHVITGYHLVYHWSALVHDVDVSRIGRHTGYDTETCEQHMRDDAVFAQ
jgi:hypothetical protein